jgi:hypothetical protein
MPGSSRDAVERSNSNQKLIIMSGRQTMAEPTEGAPPPTMQVPATPERLAPIFEQHFRTTSFGLLMCNPTVSPQIMWEAIAVAMGCVLSEATASQDIAGSLAARGHLGDLVNKAIRKRHPILATPASGAAPVNGNGLILPH